MMDDNLLPSFDDAVIRAIEKWPNVPRCFGWMRLDQRGQWRIRGEVIHHERTTAFLSRHYRADELGRWYIQNGPQQVFVTLDYTPWVFHFDADAGFGSHTGIDAKQIKAVFQDEQGNVLVVTNIGIGVIDDRDLSTLANFIEGDLAEDLVLTLDATRYRITTIQRATVADEFGFVRDPADD